MPTLSFTIPGETPSKLEVTWLGKYKKLQVFLNGEKVSDDYPFQKTLKQGYQISTPGNHIINIKYLQSWLWSSNSALEIRWDGLLLPDSETKDNIRFKDATSYTGFIAIAGFVFAFFYHATSINKPIFGLLFSTVYLVLWLFIRKNNSTALIIFTVIFTIETLFPIVFLITRNYQQEIRSYIPSMVLRIVVLFLFINAARSMMRLKNKKKEIKSTSAFEIKIDSLSSSRSHICDN